MPTVAIVESKIESARQILASLDGSSNQVRVLKSLAELGVMTGEGELHCIIFGPSFANETSLRGVEAARRQSGIATLLVAAQLDTSLLRKAMRAGVADVIPTEATSAEMIDAVRAAIESAARNAPSESSGAARGNSIVVTVFSTKGGVGKTVLSTNLAASLAAQHDRSVALLDLDLQFGDVGIAMGLRPERTIFEAAQSFDRLDSSMLSSLLSCHDSGAKALLAPTRPEDAEAITAGRVAGIIGMLRDMFEFVVIDTAPAFNDVTLSALDNSDIVYIVTMMDVASVKNTRITLQKLTQLGYAQDSIRLVLNRADSKVFLTVPEVEKAIGVPISFKIPSDLVVPRSINRGVPVVIDEPRSRVARSIAEVVRDVLDSAERRGETDVA